MVDASDSLVTPLREALGAGRLTPKVIQALGLAMTYMDYAALLDLAWSAPPLVIQSRTKSVRALLDAARSVYGDEPAFRRVEAVLLDGLTIFQQPDLRAHYASLTARDAR